MDFLPKEIEDIIIDYKEQLEDLYMDRLLKKHYRLYSIVFEKEQLSEHMIKRYHRYYNDVAWHSISRCQKLSEDFIREFQDKVIWQYITIKHNLSEDFLKEFKKKIDWSSVFRFSIDVSEDLLRECSDVINWNTLSECNKLSEEFIEEFKDKINWIALLCNNQVTYTDEFIKKYVYQGYIQKTSYDRRYRTQRSFTNYFRYFYMKSYFRHIHYLRKRGTGYLNVDRYGRYTYDDEHRYFCFCRNCDVLYDRCNREKY